MNTPKLRFKEFSGEWSSYELRQIAEINPKSKNLPESFVYIDLESVVSGRLVNEKKLLLLDAPSRAQRLLQEFDVLFQMVRPYQQNNFYFNKKGVYVASTGYAQIRTNQNNKFIYYSLHTQNFLDEVMNRCTGTSYPAINSSDLSTIILDIPSLPEQTKIASFLTAIDEKIAQLTQKHELLIQYKKGVMQQIFSQQLRFKDDNGEEFGGWEEKVFSDIYTFISTNSLSRENLNYDNGAIKNIHYGDIHTKFKSNFILNNERVPYINADVDVRKITEENYLIEKDLVIADASEDYNDIGKCIEVISVDGKKVVAGLHTYIARPIDDLALGFGGYLMKSFKVRSQIKKLATGVSVLGVSKANISKVKLDLPSKLEQTKIANFLSSIDQKIDQAAAQLDAAKQYKRGLLQQMFV